MPVYLSDGRLWAGRVWTPLLSWHLCTMHTQLLDALGTLRQGLGESPPKRTHTHTQARAHTHTQTHSAVTSLSHTHGNGLRWSKDRCPELYKSSWRTEHRSTCLPPPPSYLHTCCTALIRLPAPNLVFPQRWHMYQAEQEMSWVGREHLPDRCHLQSAQACLWCVNYSINQHIALSGCQHLITSETLPVNGVKYVCVCADDRSHIMLLLRVLLTLNHLDIHTEYVVWSMCMCAWQGGAGCSLPSSVTATKHGKKKPKQMHFALSKIWVQTLNENKNSII